MLPLNYWRELPRRAGVFAGVCAMVCAAVFFAAAGTPDQATGDAVGVIEGEDISVTGPVSMDVVGGQTKTILRSGSDVRVKSGQARISLVEGGQISICGPAHLSVLKSGGSLTVALESGAIHALLEQQPALTVYTAQIQAQTLAIGDDPREILVGFENPGLMCIRTYRGAIRVEQQLSGRSVIVPQGEDVLLADGQIDAMGNGAGHCNCELQMAKASTAAPPKSVAPPTAQERASAETAPNSSEAAVGAPSSSEKPEAKEEPIYQVDMPPLQFDASAKVQPEPDPALMAVVRRIRVRPALIFQGRVEDAPVAVAAAASPKPPVAIAPPKTMPAQGSLLNRMRSYLKRLWTRSG